MQYLNHKPLKTQHIMQLINFPLSFTLTSYQEDYTFQNILDELPKAQITRELINYNPDEDDTATEEITFNRPQDLTDFLLHSFTFIAHITACHGADDDYFDYIPLFLEEYKALLIECQKLIGKRDLGEENYYTRSLKNTITLAIEFFNLLIQNHQDQDESCNNPLHWFSAEFKPIAITI